LPKFIHTEDGYINADRIVRVFGHKTEDNVGRDDKSVVARIEYIGADGMVRTTEVRVLKPDDIMEELLPVIPAAPGYFVVEVDEEAPHEISREPVIAWRIHPRTSLQPVCLNNDQGGAVLCPDGSVWIPGDAVYSGVEKFRQEYIKARQPAKKAADTDKPDAT
jgi:hypothetical protein